MAERKRDKGMERHGNITCICLGELLKCGDERINFHSHHETLIKR